ncbi:transmembrane amino acid transporter [Colletotrichum tofieldiae]|nr:transmembrane amino acid transporter [Colletotrichum tofieldiae]GKT79534.1 transmembrane amino acid transporter [Colletotrichum tofieldiae]GKT84104.1 transmembrane amino acid transporter [Colletotrichum tofieldiae]
MPARPVAPASTDAQDHRNKQKQKPHLQLGQTTPHGNGHLIDMAEPSANLHDPNVTFEEYLYWASVTRAEEKLANERFLQAQGPVTLKSVIKDRFRKGDEHVRFQGGSEGGGPEDVNGGEKNADAGDKALQPAREGDGGVVTPEEWKRASRAVRTAGWGAIFYLITTDILGPFSTP